MMGREREKDRMGRVGKVGNGWEEDVMERAIGLERKEGKGGNGNSRRREKVRDRWGEGKERNGKEGKEKWKGESNERRDGRERYGKEGK